jgi:hypothetical protein
VPAGRGFRRLQESPEEESRRTGRLRVLRWDGVRAGDSLLSWHGKAQAQARSREGQKVNCPRTHPRLRPLVCCQPQTWTESTLISARSQNEPLRINGIADGEKNPRTGFVHTPRPSRIIAGIALAGTGSGPGIGRAAVTSPRGFGSHGPEGVRRAGIPERSAMLR